MKTLAICLLLSLAGCMAIIGTGSYFSKKHEPFLSLSKDVVIVNNPLNVEVRVGVYCNWWSTYEVKVPANSHLDLKLKDIDTAHDCQMTHWNITSGF